MNRLLRYKLIHPFLQYIPSILLLLIIASGLININYFYSTTIVAFYGFCVSTLLFAITPPHFLYTFDLKQVTTSKPIIIFGFWCLYVLTRYFTATGTVFFAIYSVVLFFLLLNTTRLFSTPNFKFKPFFFGIITIASVESLYCIGQFLGVIKSLNNQFTVTGSWNNPNVTALFLALTIPVFLFLLNGKSKKIVLTGLLILILSLVLLQCRAALIGTAIAVFIFYSLEFRFINWIKNKKNRFSAKAVLILGLLIIIPLSSQLYNAKKASADGRKFIWKVASFMALEQPITGYGYGFFEKEYNLYQANYIQKGKATTDELANAGPAIMPHNELIQNAVEGGSIGLILISLFFGSLLWTIKLKNNTEYKNLNSEIKNSNQNSVFNLAYAGVTAFIAMSIINSTIKIVPVMCMLMLYAAIICSNAKPLSFFKTISVLTNKIVLILFKTTIIITSLYLLYLLFLMATADRQNKKAKFLKETSHATQALQLMPNLEPHLQQYSDYWANYGSIYFELHQYQAALNCFKQAQKLSSQPEIYIGTGACYEKLEQYDNSIQAYQTLVAFHPSKFSYKMLLLNTYLKNKNSDKAILLAQEIIQLKPKIPSEKVTQYKNRCCNLLIKLGVPSQVKAKLNFNKNYNNTYNLKN